MAVLIALLCAVLIALLCASACFSAGVGLRTCGHACKNKWACTHVMFLKWALRL